MSPGISDVDSFLLEKTLRTNQLYSSVVRVVRCSKVLAVRTMRIARVLSDALIQLQTLLAYKRKLWGFKEQSDGESLDSYFLDLDSNLAEAHQLLDSLEPQALAHLDRLSMSKISYSMTVVKRWLC